MSGTGPRRSAADAPSVAVETGAHTTPGGAATLRLHARNLAPEARDLRVSVVGLEESWRPALAVLPAVAADETVSVDLVLMPAAGAAPGDYPFLLVVESGSARTVADATLRVDGSSDVVLSVEPAEVRGVRRKRVDVVVGNTGPGVAEVALAASGDQGIDVSLSETAVRLGPSESVRVPATVRARLRLVGSRTRHGYEVVATGHAAPRRAQGAFTSRALLGSGVLRATAVLAVMALWVAGALVVLPRVADHFTADDPAPTVADGSGSGNGDGPADGSGAGDDGASGDGQGGGPDAGADAQDEGLRVSGTVSGAEPGGVAVEVVPTASLWSSGMPADAGRSRTSASPGKVAAAAMPLAPVGTPQRLTTRTNDSGVWALQGLSTSSRYLVTISKPGFATHRVVMTGAELAAKPLETAMQAGEGSMSGVVIGPGGAVGGVEITLTDGTTTITTRTATTGAVGRWRVDGLVTPSTYLVTAASADLGTESRLVPLPAAGSRELELVLDAGVAAISGQVVGVDSLGGVGGLGGITVTATNGTTTRTATTVTGEGAGRFLLPRLPVPASYTVTISGTGYSTVTRQVNLTSDGVSGWQISLTSSGGVVTGAVTDETGTGITAAGLVLTHGSNTATVYKTMSASDGSGTFRFSGVAPGSYVLSAESFGHETTYAEVVVRPGGIVEVDLVLRRIPRDGLVATASIIGRVVDASTGGQIECPFIFDDQPCVVTATVVAEDIDGTSRTITSTAEPDDPYRLPATGSAVDGLLPGRYEVTITAPGYEPGRVTVTVPMAAEAEAATVALEPSPSLTGSVLPRTGVLPDGACVVARPTGAPAIADPCGQDVPECSTATSRCVPVVNGVYRMDRLSAGDYTVTVERLEGGYVEPQPQELHLRPGEVRRFDVLLERNGILSISMLRSNGAGTLEPANGYWVRIDGVPGLRPVQISDGFAQLTNIPPGTYTVVGSAEEESPELASTVVSIGYNQEIAIQLVLTAAVQAIPSAVTYQIAPGISRPVAGAQIQITGIVGYTGTWPSRDTRTFITDALGSVVLCTVESPDCPQWLGLVEDVVDVIVTVPGAGGGPSDFVVYRALGVPFATLGEIVLTASAQPFSGRVQITSESSDAPSPAGTRLEVLRSPPGVVGATAEADAAGDVTFVDPALPDGQIRPGQYTIIAQRDGFTSQTINFTVPLLSVGPMDTVTWVMLQDSRLGIQAYAVVLDEDGNETTTNLTGAVMTLTGPNDLRLVRTPELGETVVDFGTLPAGSYQVHINIAGYAPTTQAVAARPGAVLTSPTRIRVERLGTITGSVVTVLGPSWTQALPGAQVSATSAAGSYTVTTQADGRYRITGTLENPGLLAEDWDLTATAPSHQNDPDAGEPDGTAYEIPVDGDVVTAPLLGLAPDRTSLTVTVVDGTTPVGDLSAQLVYTDVDRVLVITPCDDDDDDATCATDPETGTYHFTGLLPLTYTLFLSGGGYMPLSTPVTIAAGTPQNLQVPITAPAGSIQGQVLRTVIGGSTSPVPGSDLVQVQVRPTGSDPVDVPIDATGNYVLEDVAAGVYTVVVQERTDTDSDWVDLAGRTVQVLSGQSAVVDLVIPLVSRPVAVTVTSTNGTDLAGGLVTLHGTVDGAAHTLGPQPLGRSGSGFTTTFAQVPPGSWYAEVSGPAGHHGSYSGTAVQVTGSSPAVVPAGVSVAETELRLQVPIPAAGPHEPPAQVTVTATPSGTLPTGVTVGPVTATLIPGASDSVLYVPAVGWSLAVQQPAQWDAVVSPASVAPDAVRVLAQVTLTPEPVATATALEIDDASVVIGTAITGTATVTAATAGDPAPTGGSVTVAYRPDGGDDEDWVEVAPVSLSGGTVAVEIGTTGWAAGDYEVRATFNPPDGWVGSSDAADVTVEAPAAGGDDGD